MKSSLTIFEKWLSVWFGDFGYVQSEMTLEAAIEIVNTSRQTFVGKPAIN